jgi:ABC-type multidrug transport system permease subunit
MPNFLLHRTIYEVRERHSGTYRASTFLFASILAEIPYHILLGCISFSILNYTLFGIRSPSDQGLSLLYFVYFYVYAGTFAHMVVAALPDGTTAARATTILFSMMVLFAGVFQPPDALPGFWIFMYRVSPMTYLVGGLVAVGLSGNEIVCAEEELAVFQPPSGITCAEYMAEAFRSGSADGTLLDPGATSDCQYCPLRSANQVLGGLQIEYSDRWRNWGFGLVYVAFNIICVFVLYYLFRLGRLKAFLKRVFGRVVI